MTEMVLIGEYQIKILPIYRNMQLRSSKPEVYYYLPSELATSLVSPETRQKKRSTPLVSIANDEQLGPRSKSVPIITVKSVLTLTTKSGVTTAASTFGDWKLH